VEKPAKLYHPIALALRSASVALNLLLLIGPASFAARTLSPALSHFEQGNKYYEERKYREAISEYHWLEAHQSFSPALLFNLGNAHFKNEETGRAIYAYLNASLLAPRDPDIQANLKFARDSVGSSISVLPNAAERLISYLSLNELAVIACILLWAWIILLIFPRVRPSVKGKYRGTTTVLGFLFLFWSVWLIAASVQRNAKTAIVVEREAIVRLGPLDESQTSFTASDGTELAVVARRNGWLQVSDRQGRTGWVRDGSVLVFPTS